MINFLIRIKLKYLTWKSSVLLELGIPSSTIPASEVCSKNEGRPFFSLQGTSNYIALVLASVSLTDFLV